MFSLNSAFFRSNPRTYRQNHRNIYIFRRVLGRTVPAGSLVTTSGGISSEHLLQLIIFECLQVRRVRLIIKYDSRCKPKIIGWSGRYNQEKLGRLEYGTEIVSCMRSRKEETTRTTSL